MVVPGTPRDSLHILDALLNLDGGVKPEMVATDNASYSDMVFGIFKILGYNFSPRFKDLDDQRFWRAAMPGVETGDVRAAGGPGPQPGEPQEDRSRGGRTCCGWPAPWSPTRSAPTTCCGCSAARATPRPLGQAFAEYGRIAKTEHLLARGRPGRRHLPPPDEPAAHRPGVAPQAGQGRVPRQARHHPPGVPRRHGGPARRARPGPERRRAVDDPVHRRRRRPAPRRGPRDSGTRTSPDCPRSSTGTSTSSAATASPPPPRPAAPCARCATRTRLSWTRTRPATVLRTDTSVGRRGRAVAITTAGHPR